MHRITWSYTAFLRTAVFDSQIVHVCGFCRWPVYCSLKRKLTSSTLQGLYVENLTLISFIWRRGFFFVTVRDECFLFGTLKSCMQYRSLLNVKNVIYKRHWRHIAVKCTHRTRASTHPFILHLRDTSFQYEVHQALLRATSRECAHSFIWRMTAAAEEGNPDGLIRGVHVAESIFVRSFPLIFGFYSLLIHSSTAFTASVLHVLSPRCVTFCTRPSTIWQVVIIFTAVFSVIFIITINQIASISQINRGIPSNEISWNEVKRMPWWFYPKQWNISEQGVDPRDAL